MKIIMSLIGSKIAEYIDKKAFKVLSVMYISVNAWYITHRSFMLFNELV